MLDDDRNGHVAADMARVFAPIAGRLPPARTDEAAAIAAVPRTPRASGRRFLFAAPVLVAVAGAALASIYVSEAGGPDHPAAPGASVISSAGAGTPTGSDTVAAPTELSLREAGSPSPAADSQRTASGDDESRTTRPAILPRAPSGTLGAAPERAPSGRAPNRSPEDVASTRNRPRCDVGSLDDQCIYQDVLNADNRLRSAFARAQRSGVPSGRLTAIQRRWTMAREDAESDPDGTIRRYDQLADILDQERRDIVE